MRVQKSMILKAENTDRKWLLVDATDMVVGRLASEVATILRGKNKPSFTPNVDGGDFVVVVNCEKVKFTGSIAPFSIVSKFISVVPAVGELLTGSNKKGVISGQFKLNGKVSDPKIDINLLSFSPGILRQIFSKNWINENKDWTLFKY